MTSKSTYCMIQDYSGMLLNGAGPLTAGSLANDDCMWIRRGNALSCATSNIRLTIKELELEGNGNLRCQLQDRQANAIESPADTHTEPDTFLLIQGPDKLPSVHLSELKTTGFTVLENVLDAAAIIKLKQAANRQRASKYADEDPNDGHFWMMTGLLWSPEVARASCHPVAMWLLQQYMQTEAIHFCHQPILTTLKPAKELKGTFPDSGWHSDYPYHPGVFPDDHWPQSPVLGAQYNVCIDSFMPETAGTQYLPGSHRLGKIPPPDFNTGGTRMGQGLHKDVVQMVAPAGAAIIYDARTWHRACYELNVSGRDRIALLNAVTPAWVFPMLDKALMTERYLASDAALALTHREQNDITRLCHSPARAVPEGMPILSESSLVKQ